ncbi:MAG: RDD family protein [Candidatus Bathyarchaeota archaeon]|nr:RDD family protein [Candidatus Bathyarchaeota archaeon]
MTTGSSSELDLNHWLFRFLALVIDSIIIGIPAYIIFWLLSGILWPSYTVWGVTVSYAPWWSWFLMLFILGLLQVLYFAFMEVNSGATIGKKVLGFKVQMVNGSKLMFNAAFIRNISKIYGFFLLLDWIIGIATPGPDRRQKYTDRMAGTTVVQVKQAFASASPPPPPPPS